MLGQHFTVKRAVIECRMQIGFEDPICKACGVQGQARGTVTRRLAHVPVGWRPTQQLVHVRRFACTRCRRVRSQDISALAQSRALLTRLAVEGGDAYPFAGVYVGLPGSSRPGDPLARHQQRNPDPGRADLRPSPATFTASTAWRSSASTVPLRASLPCAIAVVWPGFRTWPRARPRRSSRPGFPPWTSPSCTSS